MKAYRGLIKANFPNVGSFESPSIFLDSVPSRTRICIGTRGYMRIYIKVKSGLIEDIRYLCSCDPTANVAVEVMCNLVRGKTLDVAAGITQDMFLKAMVGPSEDLRKSAAGLIELLNEGIKKYRSETQPLST